MENRAQIIGISFVVGLTIGIVRVISSNSTGSGSGSGSGSIAGSSGSLVISLIASGGSVFASGFGLFFDPGGLPGPRFCVGGAAIRRASLLASGSVEGHVH